MEETLDLFFEMVTNVQVDHLAIWIFIAIAILSFILIIERKSPEAGDLKKVNKVIELSKNDLMMIQEGMFYPIQLEDKLKCRLIIDHSRSLKELNNAAEKCYLIKNAMECIRMVSYCPHLVNVPDKSTGRTAFHQVCAHGHTCLISFMLEKGANPSLKTTAGESAFELALRWTLNHRDSALTAIDILRDSGCIVDINNPWHRIYLQSALMSNNQKLVRWMYNNSVNIISRTTSSTQL